MANTKISQLPIWTGTAADLRWFVMNNSGETETFKFSGYTSPFRYIDSTLKNAVYLGTLDNTITSSGNNNIILNGNTNTISGSGSRSTIIGGTTNTLTNNDSIIESSDSSTNNGIQCSILSSQSSFIGSTYRGFVAATYDCRINGGVVCSIIGGYQNIINVDGYSSILNGYNNSINGGNYNQVLNGLNNTISTASNNSTIVGGDGNTISGKTRSVMIGCSGRTANADNTTFVENLHTYRTPSTQVQPISSGTTFTCNLDNGAKSQFYITGTSTINITNVRDGASFMIKTQTDGNYVMTWTATGGYTFVFEGGIKDPGNNVTDIFVFEVFGSVIYGNRRHNYS